MCYSPSRSDSLGLVLFGIRHTGCIAPATPRLLSPDIFNTPYYLPYYPAHTTPCRSLFTLVSPG